MQDSVKLHEKQKLLLINGALSSQYAQVFHIFYCFIAAQVGSEGSL